MLWPIKSAERELDMGMLNGYMNERIEAEKAKGLFAIARAIDGLAKAIIQANRERLEALKKSEVANADNAQEDD